MTLSVVGGELLDDDEEQDDDREGSALWKNSIIISMFMKVESCFILWDYASLIEPSRLLARPLS